MRYDGVKEYVKGELHQTINFPVDFNGKKHIACVYCPHMGNNGRTCRLNNQPLFMPEKFTGYYCPLKIEE